jgi:hypothetical protein
MVKTKEEFVYRLFDKLIGEYIGSYATDIWFSRAGAISAIKWSRHTNIELHKFSLSLIEKTDYTAQKLVDKV